MALTIIAALLLRRERHEKIWQHFQMWQSWVMVTR